MTMSLEARGFIPEKAIVVHSPVLDAVRQELLSHNAYISPYQNVESEPFESAISFARVYQFVELFVAPAPPVFDWNGDKGEYAERYALHLGDTLLNLRKEILSTQASNIDHSDANVLPVRHKYGVSYGKLFFDEMLGSKRTEEKTTVTEAYPGSLIEVGMGPEERSDDFTMPLVRRIAVNIYPHPLLALIVPRIQANRTLPQDDLTVGISIDRLSDIQRSGAKSGTVAVALSLGVVTEQELEQIFSPNP